jgi:thiamine-phosphate pyrophosphorylase
VKLDPFYLIVDHVDWIARLAPLGVKLVQLRIKDQPQDEIRAQVRKAKGLMLAQGGQLVVNDYWQIAIEEACDFVHLGQEDLAEADLPALRRAGIAYGLSSHDEAELERALAAEPAYVALGPIYPTLLKQMPWAPQGLERLAEWRRRVGSLPLVAIGGLTPERLPGVFAAGADSAAVVTDVLRHPDPEKRTRDWLAATRSLPLM